MLFLRTLVYNFK